VTAKKDWRDVFIAKLSKSPNVSAAARSAKVSRQTVYRVREEEPEFAAAWDEALAISLDDAEGELYRRAVKGTVKPVFQGGVQVGGVREYSDTLLIFMLKAHKPEVYRETVRNELSGKDGGPIETTVKHDLSRLSVDELKAMRDMVAKATNADS